MTQYLKLKPEDEAWLKRREEKEASKINIDQEQLIIAEFGVFYGWGGVMAILNNDIDSETVSWLITAARKIRHSINYDNAQSAFIGAISAQTKKPSDTFNKATLELRKHMRADV